MPWHGWIDVIGKLGPLLLTVVIAVIAYRQWSTARHKLRLDVFDRRFGIHTAFQSFRSAVEVEGSATDAHMAELQKGCRQLQFFFRDRTLGTISEDIWSAAWDVYWAQTASKRPNESEREKAYEKFDRRFKDYKEAHEKFKAIVEPLMRVEAN
jgi:hypothetical protein